ncbi:MAG: RecQ family ATP-dependent DNA helicase [Candidatus Gracilibacteria bacterium]|nr:RecQ family ATP-dependent DNA helicase [Candidatus Gracilibacteria bacterium]MDD3120097.1 RecQ family ATP-dependent DNA helicase [Candidatus Gracilibacteria bacterium]MDD4530432.1 RecQ family ATP-dependent DNA helicase [Candidatus Gracilibacteria bacterium]
MQNLEKILKEVFKLKVFNEGQKDIIENVINQKDTLVFMPTGGGKSLTYQLPGVVLDGLTIVISPLISLMKDQIDKLNELNIRAEVINSTISQSEQKMILRELSQISFADKNPIKFLYIAPERLNSDEFLNVLQSVKIALVAIDEAHCISQWGHDFRPSYMKIKGFLEQLKQNNSFPVMALTATATKKVRQDIIDRLKLTDYNIFTKGFDRKNIIILVREISKKEEKLAKTLEILQKTPGSGIIYCSSRKMVDEVYTFLKANKESVGVYTGAMTSDQREFMQNNFMDGKYRVIVATNAFGMGIDKKDIRFVIHYNLPGSIENYYQEVGRAGRDSKKSFGIVLASYGDTKIQEFFIENTYPGKSEILDFYHYLYKDFMLGEGRGHQILKTYAVMAGESGVKSDMKVGSILKILEKYGILSKGFDQDTDEGFRGRGVTLIQEKRKDTGILIDWQKQELLEQEAYYKLEQIKKLLFYPSCRKRFILEYFGDEEDLVTLGDNCGVCDYCIEKDKFDNGKTKNLVNLSVFEIVLDVVKKFDRRFGVQVFVDFLQGNRDKKGLSEDKDYGVLAEYSGELVQGLIESLLMQGFLEKTSGMYPVLSLTDKGSPSIKREQVLKSHEHELQSYLAMKVKDNVFKKIKKGLKGIGEKISSKIKVDNTYLETLKLFQEGKSVKEIAKNREMSTTTIEGHISKLYENGDLLRSDILKIADIDNLKNIKKVIDSDFSGQIDKLRFIKDRLEELGFSNISYLEIKVCIAMMEKKEI